MEYQPGTYLIELRGNDPFLTDPAGNPLEDPRFVAHEFPSEFTFEIRSPDRNFGFGPQALEWRDKGVAVPQPDSIRSSLQGGTLTLTVFPLAVIVSDVHFNFVLFFNNGKQIEALTAHGLRPLDPTIIEKAVEPPRHPQDEARSDAEAAISSR